jgi:hypothetical protein
MLSLMVAAGVSVAALGCTRGSSGSGGKTSAATGSASGTSGTVSTTATGSSGATTSAGTGGAAPGACPGTGAEITTLPACTSNTTSTVNVVRGCEPTIDGTLHADEWADGTCFTAGDMTVVAKYAGDALYLAASGMPSCGCPMRFYFDPDGSSAAPNDEFAIGVFDDPFNKDGDRADFVYQGGKYVQGTAPAGIVTACPGMQPIPIRYEIKIPFTAIGVTAGSPRNVGLAFVHAAAKWPAGLALDATGAPTDVTSWGILGSSSWK